MIPKYTQIEYDSANQMDKLSLECEQCGELFYVKKKQINQVLNGNSPDQYRYCCRGCKEIGSGNRINVTCANCEIEIWKRKSDCQGENNFCSRTCAAIYNNKIHIKRNTRINSICKHCNHEYSYIPSEILSKSYIETYCSYTCMHGGMPFNIFYCCDWCNKLNNMEYGRFHRKGDDGKIIKHFCDSSCRSKWNNRYNITQNPRPKIEHYIERKLNEDFQQIDIKYNIRSILEDGLEFDIYIPEIKLAFELNGPTHYKDIYNNPKRFKQQIYNDKRKYDLCMERGIILCSINTSNQKNYTDSGHDEYYQIIKTTIYNVMG